MFYTFANLNSNKKQFKVSENKLLKLEGFR